MKNKRFKTTIEIYLTSENEKKAIENINALIIYLATTTDLIGKFKKIKEIPF